MNEGTCQRHNRQFVLTEGCSECLTEIRQAGIRPEQEEMEAGLNAEGLILSDAAKEAGAEVTEVTILPQIEQRALIKVNPDLDISVREIYSKAVRLLDFAQSREIKTVAGMKDATNDQVIIGNFKKDIEAKRVSYTGPINDHLKAVNQAFKDFAAPLLQADQLNRANMNKYRLAQEALIAEQERINRLRMEAAQAEMELKGELTESVQVIEVQAPVAKSVRTDMGTSTSVDHWKARVFDFKLLSDEWKLENTSLLNTHARTHKGQRPIPGVEFYNDPDIRTTRRQIT